MERVTPGICTLLGDPKRAIVQLSLPMMVAMLVQSLYNVVDAIWVSGLGQEALAAVGLFFPFFIGILALAMGLGIGGSAAISRRIGARDRPGASNTAIHTFALGLGFALLLTTVFLPIAGRLFPLLGASKEVSQLAAAYARVLFGGSAIIFFANLGTAVLRGEGDVRRAMYAMILGSVLNVGLDPLFIYGLRLGVVGAAWATLTSLFVSAALIFRWLFVRRVTYVDLVLSAFWPRLGIAGEILRVGIPASLSQLSMSLSMMTLNWVLLRVGGEAGVAVFTSGWRLVNIGTIPLMGIATGVTAVTGASFGARDGVKLRTGYLYAVRIGVMIELAAAAFLAGLAPWLALLFTYAEGSAGLRPGLTSFLRWMAVFLPAVPFGMLTSAMFNGIGMGERALLVTVLRTLVFQVLGAYVMGVVLGLGELGVWWGILLGNVIMGAGAFLWGYQTITALARQLFPLAEPVPNCTTSGERSWPQ